DVARRRARRAADDTKPVIRPVPRPDEVKPAELKPAEPKPEPKPAEPPQAAEPPKPAPGPPKPAPEPPKPAAVVESKVVIVTPPARPDSQAPPAAAAPAIPPPPPTETEEVDLTFVDKASVAHLPIASIENLARKLAAERALEQTSEARAAVAEILSRPPKPREARAARNG